MAGIFAARYRRMERLFRNHQPNLRDVALLRPLNLSNLNLQMFTVALFGSEERHGYRRPGLCDGARNGPVGVAFMAAHKSRASVDSQLRRVNAMVPEPCGVTLLSLCPLGGRKGIDPALV